MKNSRLSKSIGHGVFVSTILVLFFLQIGISNLLAGDLVRRAQESLLEKGINPGPVDGLWGPLTKGAVIKFQEKEGLPVSGRLDDPTKKRLLSSVQETQSGEKAAPVQTTQESTKPEVPVVSDEKIVAVPDEAQVKKDSPKQISEIPAAAPVPPESKPAIQPHPEPKAKGTSGLKKASAPCLQPKKTKSAPASIAKMDKTDGANIDKGKKIYNKTAKPMACKMCHGDNGDGKGKLGAALKPKPRNFTCAGTMKEVSAGQMFWIIKNGSPGTGMVAHKKSLKDKEIWDVIKYIRSTFMDETPSAGQTASKPISEEPPATVPSPSEPEVAVQPSPAPKAASRLPAGFKVTGKYEEGTVSNGGSISGVIHFRGKAPVPIMEDLSKEVTVASGVDAKTDFELVSN